MNKLILLFLCFTIVQAQENCPDSTLPNIPDGCPVTDGTCQSSIYFNDGTKNICGCPDSTSTHIRDGCPVTTGTCESKDVNGNSITYEGICGCPDSTFTNIPNDCKVNLEQGSCESGYYEPDETHHDIYCRVNNGGADNCYSQHCIVLDEKQCQYHSGFYYIHNNEKRCCPELANPAYFDQTGKSTIDHIPGGCPVLTEYDNDGNLMAVYNIDDRSPCEERDQYSSISINNQLICCPFKQSPNIPDGCEVQEGGQCQSGFSVDNICGCTDPNGADIPDGCPVSTGTCQSKYSNGTNIYRVGTYSGVEINICGCPHPGSSDIPDECEVTTGTCQSGYIHHSNSAFKCGLLDGAVILNANVEVSDLAVVSAAKLKEAYQRKANTCQ